MLHIDNFWCFAGWTTQQKQNQLPRKNVQDTLNLNSNQTFHTNHALCFGCNQSMVFSWSVSEFQHQNAGHINSHSEPSSHFESYPANIMDWTIEPTPSNNESRSISPKPERPNSTVAVDCIPCQVTKAERKLKGQGGCISLVKESTKRFQVPHVQYTYCTHMIDGWYTNTALQYVGKFLQYIWLIYIYICSSKKHGALSWTMNKRQP